MMNRILDAHESRCNVEFTTSSHFPKPDGLQVLAYMCCLLPTTNLKDPVFALLVTSLPHKSSKPFLQAPKSFPRGSRRLMT